MEVHLTLEPYKIAFAGNRFLIFLEALDKISKGGGVPYEWEIVCDEDSMGLLEEIKIDKVAELKIFLLNLEKKISSKMEQKSGSPFFIKE